MPIERLNQARRRRNTADKAIDLGISFESLFLGDRSPKEEISFSFRLRAAWHLGNNKEQREELTEVFCKIYDCRSRAVHRGKIEEKIKLKNRGKIETPTFLKEADALCVESIRRIIQRGEFPDWNRVILGG